MKTLAEACVPRRNVFDRSCTDTALDLTDLMDGTLNTKDFFSENYVTEGMKILVKATFDRLHGKSDQGLFLLKQAMGGGKTHNLIALGLLAKETNSKLRKSILEQIEPTIASLSNEEIRIAAFTGRESDARYGIWGAIAEQLGKNDSFSQYYSPLSAPGQTAWISLLKGKPLLILLDELPPYFENAKAHQIGNSDLAAVTTTALSNLFVAVNKPELSNVCVVVTDLDAEYEGGSGQILEALQKLKKESGRSAVAIEPVRMNTDELYQILRTRLFETVASNKEIAEISSEYRKAIADCVEMSLTQESPDALAAGIISSYCA